MHHKYPDVVAVLGVTGAGKSTFTKEISLNNKIRIGHGLEPCTQLIIPSTFNLDGREIILVDTPGFNDAVLSDQEIHELIVNWMVTTYRQKTRLKGIIYCHPITNNRIGGSSVKYMRMFRSLCGDDFLQSVVLMTTMWDLVDEQEGKRREEQLSKDFWGIMISEGAKVARYKSGNIEEGYNTIRYLICKESNALKIQDDIVNKKINLKDTDSARLLSSDEMSREAAMHRDTISNIHKERDMLLKEQFIKQKIQQIKNSIRENENYITLKHREVSIYRNKNNNNCDTIYDLERRITNTNDERALRAVIPFWNVVEAVNILTSTKNDDRRRTIRHLSDNIRCNNLQIETICREINAKYNSNAGLKYDLEEVEKELFACNT